MTLSAMWGTRRVVGFTLGILCVATALPAVQVLEAQRSTRDTTVRVTDNAVVDVTVRNGRLVVRGIDGTSGTVRASNTNYQLRSTGVTLTLNTRDERSRDDDRRDDDRRNNRGRDRRDDDVIELDVPRGVRLVVSTQSADVEVRDITGAVEIRSTTGDLMVAGISGRVIVETLSGDIDATGTSALLRATTMSGDMQLRDVRGEVEVHTTSGDISVNGERLTRVTVASISGDVELGGDFADDARLRVTTHNGDVTVHVPSNVRGRLEVSTQNGDLTANGPLTLLPGDVAGTRQGRSTRRYEFVGTGTGNSLQLDISTFNGDIRLVRGIRS